MAESEKPQVIAVSAFQGTERIDGGDTIVLRFKMPGGEELAVLVPHRIAAALNGGLEEELARTRGQSSR